ncbi:TRAP transporter substrate-binding protein DctP [Chloroflexota bacterium]
MPIPHPATPGYALFIERVNERSKGELTLDYLGGPEVIPMFEQGEALRTGVIDINYNVTAFYLSHLPEGDAFPPSEITPMEERERGFYDLMVELHKEKMNAYYLGRITSNFPYGLATNIRVETPYDLVGQKFTSSGPVFVPLLNELGIVPYVQAITDMYTSLERGMVDGAAGPATSFVQFHQYEVCKYWINEPIWSASNGVLLVNLDTFNKLPKHQQDLLKDVAAEVESELDAMFTEIFEGLYKTMRDNGVEFIEFSPTDSKWFQETTYRVIWEKLEQRVSPEMYAKLRDLVRK